MKLAFNKIITDHKYSWIFFVVIMTYGIVIREGFPWSIDEITYTYHLVDYKIGYLYGILPGHIYNLLFDNTSFESVNLFVNISLIVCFALICVLLNRFLRVQTIDNQKYGFILICFYLTGPATFSIFINEMGMLDVYWLFTAVLFFLFLSNKYLSLLIPLLGIATIAIHAAGTVTYVVLFGIVLLYKISTCQKEKKLYIFGFILFLVFVLSAFVFLVVMKEEHLLYSLDEFHNLLNSRKDSDIELYTAYYEYSFFGMPYLDDWGYNQYSNINLYTNNLIDSNSTFATLVNLLWAQAHQVITLYIHTMPELIPTTILGIIIVSPMLFVIYKSIIFLIKNTRNAFKKMILYLVLIQYPFSLITGIICSPDVVRWSAHAFLILFTLFIYFLYKEKDIWVELHSVFNYIKKEFILGYFVIYLSSNIHPYC